MSETSELTLDSLRAEGAHSHDPARFYYLETLTRRMQTQPRAVQQVLERRLQRAVADYAARAQLVTGPSTARPTLPATDSPLAQLNRDLSARVQADTDTMWTGDDASLPNMKSVRQFSEVWSKISAEQQVVQALHRGPENAGPLNSHKLMLRSLSLMRALSPDYLRRFLSQVDSLLWLEQASTKHSSSTAKPGRKSRPKQ